MNTWQPIETAPKDGSEILILGRTYGVKDRYIAVSYFYEGEFPADESGDSYINVTHWMPLPEPPKE